MRLFDHLSLKRLLSRILQTLESKMVISHFFSAEIGSERIAATFQVLSQEDKAMPHRRLKALPDDQWGSWMARRSYC